MEALEDGLTPAQRAFLTGRPRRRDEVHAGLVTALENKGLARFSGRRLIPTHIGRRVARVAT